MTWINYCEWTMEDGCILVPNIRKGYEKPPQGVKALRRVSVKHWMKLFVLWLWTVVMRGDVGQG